MYSNGRPFFARKEDHVLLYVFLSRFLIFRLFRHFLFLDIKDLMFYLVRDFSQKLFPCKKDLSIFSINKQSSAVVHFAYLNVCRYSSSSPEGNKHIFSTFLFLFFVFLTFFPVIFSVERFNKCRI